MIRIGRGIRWYNDFQQEVAFSQENGFEFMQIWFKDGRLLITGAEGQAEKAVRECGFPIILHAVFDPSDFDLYGGELLKLLERLGHSEVIIHPVCKKEPITADTENRLARKVREFSRDARDKGIVFYLENNSMIDGFHCTAQELKTVFAGDDYVEQLLDVAHVQSYAHLEQIINVKYPKCLHVAGKHFSVPHEHLSLTQGDIDYAFVFKRYLRDFCGRIILEVDGPDDEIIASRRIVEEAVLHCHHAPC